MHSWTKNPPFIALLSLGAVCWCASQSVMAAEAEVPWPVPQPMGGHGTAPAWPILKREPAKGAPWTRHTIDDSMKGADGVKLGDVNGDGLPDIVVGWEESGVTRLYLNPGAGRSSSKWPSVVVGKTPGIEDAMIVDLDGDGALDVISCCEGQYQKIFIHWGPKNKGDLLTSAKWEQVIFPTESAAPQGGLWMFAGAMQIDGRNGPDLIAGGKKGRPKDMGWFEEPANPRDLAGWTWHPIAPAQWTMDMWQRDMNGDGRTDLIITDRRTCRWLENPGPGPAQTQPWPSHVMGATKSKHREMMFCAPGDLDGDRLVDWIVAINNYEILWLRRCDPSGKKWDQRSIVVNAGNGYIKAAVISDINGDGRPDIAFSGSTADKLHGCMWLENTGDPAQMNGWPAHSISGNQAGMKWDRIEMLDMNGDGALDMVTTEEGNDREKVQGLGLVWFENPHAQKTRR